MLFCYLFISIIIIFGIQFIVIKITNTLNERINNNAEKIAREINESKIKKSKNNLIKEVKEVSEYLMLALDWKKKFHSIIFWLGFLETLIFIGLTFLLLKHTKDLGSLKIIIQVAGGWIALKIFGSYPQWQLRIFGRASFHVFLIGSVVNILLAVIIGYCLSILI